MNGIAQHQGPGVLPLTLVLLAWRIGILGESSA